MAAFARLKNYKSPGLDGIPKEAYNELPDAVDDLIDLTTAIWNTETAPEDYATGIVILLYKKGSKEDYKNYRGIWLGGQSTKIESSCARAHSSVPQSTVNGWSFAGCVRGNR